MLKTIVASLNEADAAKLLRRANLLEQASDQSAIELGEARRSNDLLMAGLQTLALQFYLFTQMKLHILN